MCLVHRDVRIWTTWPSVPHISCRSGSHRRGDEQEYSGHVIGGHPGDVGDRSRDAITGGTVHGTQRDCTECMPPPWTNNWAAQGDQRSQCSTFPAADLRSLQDAGTNMGTGERLCRSQEEASLRRNIRRASGEAGQNDTGGTKFWWGGEQCVDGASQYPNPSCEGGSGCSSGKATRGPEFSRLARHFRVGSNPTEWLDCTPQDGNAVQPWKLSQWTFEDALRMQPPEGCSLGPVFATCPGWQNNWAERPTSICTTPGSSFRRPRLGGHSGKDNSWC